MDGEEFKGFIQLPAGLQSGRYEIKTARPKHMPHTGFLDKIIRPPRIVQDVEKPIYGVRVPLRDSDGEKAGGEMDQTEFRSVECGCDVIPVDCLSLIHDSSFFIVFLLEYIMSGEKCKS